MKMNLNLLPITSSSIIVFCLIFFSIFFFLLILFFSNNPIFSILSLMMIFCLVSIMLLILGIEFLSLLFLVVYVGAISILFLFVIMMIDLKLILVKKEKRYFLSSLISLFLFVLIFFFSFNFFDIFYYSNSKIYFIDWTFLVNYKNDIQQAGYALYNFFFYDFLITGLILFVAMIGCIALVLEENLLTKKQNLVDQLSKFLNTRFSLKITNIY